MTVSDEARRGIGWDLLEPLVQSRSPDALSVPELLDLFREDVQLAEAIPDGKHHVDPRDGAVVTYNAARARRTHDRAAGVFALPSRYEPFGMVAIEAMACGTPTVVTVHGGLSELIEFGNHALFADPFRPVEFGAMLALPMQYPGLSRELSVQGSRFARRSFGWTGIAKRITAVFDTVVGRRISRTEG